MISRDVAQRRGDLALGAITIDTPHLGALIDLNARTALAAVLADEIDGLFAAAGCTSPDDNVACALADFLANFSFFMVNYAADSAVPATQDLEPVPLSGYLNNLNGNTENFTRVGIEGHSHKRWVLMRLGGDFISGSNGPDGTFGGRNIVLATEVVYDSLLACVVIAELSGDPDTADFCAGIATQMDNIDNFWDAVTAPFDGTDGIVQGASQIYSGSTAEYVIGGADSHVGAVRSDKVRDKLINALDQQFFVPRAGCSFLLSPANTSFSGAGGTGSLSINTAINTPTACSWSAVSDVPWITISGASHGVGTSTISYTVAPNPSTTTSRSGTLTISGLVFTLTQTAGPDFTLSVTPSSQTTPAGGSTTYSVSGSALNGFSTSVSLSVALSPGGPNPNLSAGSITINGSGSSSSTLTLTTTTSTPPGSYAVTVTATGGGLTHSAAVALNVTPPPSPATGTLDIGGYVNCNSTDTGPDCDYGTLAVTINNTTETVNYSGPDYSIGQTLANAVANAFNSDPNSPVTAAASFINPDSIVVFTTTQVGSNTNYPFSVQLSSTRNALMPDSSMAQTITVSTSGLSLTGGH